MPTAIHCRIWYFFKISIINVLSAHPLLASLVFPRLGPPLTIDLTSNVEYSLMTPAIENPRLPVLTLQQRTNSNGGIDIHCWQ